MYNLLILSLNIMWIIFLFLGLVSSDSELTQNEIFLRNFIFVVFYLFVNFIKIIFLPLCSMVFPKNLYLKYLKYKLTKDKNYWKRLLIIAFLFDYFILLIFAFSVSDKNILHLVFSPFILMPFFYYLGGGVFLSYLGFVLWCNWRKKQTT